MSTNDLARCLLLGTIAGLLMGITIKLTAIQTAVENYFVTEEDEHIELCDRLGGK